MTIRIAVIWDLQVSPDVSEKFTTSRLNGIMIQELTYKTIGSMWCLLISERFCQPVRRKIRVDGTRNILRQNVQANRLHLCVSILLITWNSEVFLAILNMILTVLLDVLGFGRICRLHFQNSTVVIQKAVVLEVMLVRQSMLQHIIIQ